MVSNTEKLLPNQVLLVPVDPFSLSLMLPVSECIEKKLVGRKQALMTLISFDLIVFRLCVV